MASKDAPLLTFTGSGTSTDSPATVNGTVELIMPATAAHSWNVRCVVSHSDGPQEYVRQICIPYTLAGIDIFKSVPGETDEFYARSWSDKFNDYMTYIAAFTVPTLDQSYDAGGAGLGRAVTVDSGAIEFTGSNAADYTLEVTNSGNGGVLFINNTGTGSTIEIQDGGGSVFNIADGGDFDLDSADFDLYATGNVTVDCDAVIDIDAVNSLDIDCSAGAIGIGTTPVNFAVNIGTSGVRTITIGQYLSTEIELTALIVDINADTELTLDAKHGFISLDSYLSSNFTITADNAADQTLLLSATNIGAGGAIVAVSATDAVTIDSTAAGVSIDAYTSSNFNVTGNDAGDLSFGIGCTNGGAGGAYLNLRADDRIDLDSRGDVLIDAVDDVVINSSAGSILIGNDMVTQPISIGTGAAARTITIGNVTGATAVDILSGTGGISLKPTGGLLILSDGFQAGSGYGTDLVLSDASAEWDLFETNFGEVSILNALNQCASSAVTLDEAYNASAGASTITVDAGDLTWNEVGAYSFIVGLSGCTGAADGFFVEDGTDYFRLTHAAADTLGLDAALSSVALSASLTVDIDAAGAFSINSSAGVINIGDDPVAQDINIGTAGARTISIGSAAANAITLDAIALSLDASDDSNITVLSNSALDKSLNIHLQNDGAGEGFIGIIAGDRGLSDHAVRVSALGGVGSSVIVNADGAITLDSPQIALTATTTGLTLSSGVAIDIDATSALSLNSSAGAINIGDDAVAQDINIGTGASARTITVGNLANSTEIQLDALLIDINAGATGMTLDSAGVLSIDASDTGNFTVTDSGTLTSSLTLSSFSAIGDATLYVTSTGGTSGNIAVSATTDITFSGNGSAAIPFNDAVEVSLDAAFTATSMIGALNELKNGSTWMNIYEVAAATHDVNLGDEYAVLHVTHTGTAAVAITFKSAWLAVDGNTITIVDTGLNAAVNNISIETEGAELVMGQADGLINGDGDSITYQAFGGNLHVI